MSIIQDLRRQPEKNSLNFPEMNDLKGTGCITCHYFLPSEQNRPGVPFPVYPYPIGSQGTIPNFKVLLTFLRSTQLLKIFKSLTLTEVSTESNDKQ